MKRRSYLEITSAVGAAAVGISGVVSATDDFSSSAEEERVAKLLRKGNFGKADELADEHGLNHYTGETTRNLGEENNEGEVGTESFDIDDSTFDISVLETSGNDRWVVTVNAILRGRDPAYDGTHHAADAMGIYFDSSEWSAPDPSEDDFYGTAHWDGGPYEGDPPELVLDEYDPNAGAAAKVYIPEKFNTDRESELSAIMQITVTRADTGNDDIAIQGTYDHTWASSRLGSTDITFSVGAFSVSVNQGGSVWEPAPTFTAEPGERDEY